MTISIVASSANSNSATSGTVSVATGVNGSVGDLLTVFVGGGFSTSEDPGIYTEGELTFSGTATLVEKSLDVEEHFLDTGDAYSLVGIYTARVTVAGTITAQISKTYTAPVKQHIHVVLLDADGGGWDSGRLEDSASTTDGASNTAPATPNMTSAGAAIFMGMVHIGDTSDPNEVVGADYTEVAATGIGGAGIDSHTNSSYRIVSSGTTDAVDWTCDANNGHSVAGVVLKEAAVGGAVFPYHSIKQQDLVMKTILTM